MESDFDFVNTTIILEMLLSNCQVPRVIGKAGAIIKELRQAGISELYLWRGLDVSNPLDTLGKFDKA